MSRNLWLAGVSGFACLVLALPVHSQTLGRPVIDVGPSLVPPAVEPETPTKAPSPTAGMSVGKPSTPALTPVKPVVKAVLPGLLPIPVVKPTPLTPALRSSGFADSPAVVIPLEPKLGPMPTPVPSKDPLLVPPTSPKAAEPKDMNVNPKASVEPPAKPTEIEREKGLFDSLHHDDSYGFKSLFDSLHPEGEKGKHWYEKLSIRGYSQFRYGRTLIEDQGLVDPRLLGDRSIDGSTEGFSIRRARLIIFGDVTEHLGLYFQPDFGNIPASGSTSTFFAQLRDLYGDIYVDKEKEHRFRVGLSKIPFGFENMQSSQNRIPLDRTDSINTGVSPNERDLGVFYYWTPVEKQKLFKDLVDGGLKGSGNYGIFGAGVYSGQGGSQTEQNDTLHAVARLTYPFELPSGQVVETSLQGYSGKYVIRGAKIRALGEGKSITPKGTDDTDGFLDQRVAATFVWYPQPFGLQAEWNVGRGPGLNDAQDEVLVRQVNGGYLMAMYKLDTANYGIFTPYGRYQRYSGGYRSLPNAPYGTHDQIDVGIEWQIRKEMELVVEYSFVDGVTLNAIDEPGKRSYQNFDGGILRLQFQINY